MKIIQLCPNLNQGGVERGIIEISKILDNQKDIVNYVCSNGGQLVSELKDSKHYKLSIHKKNPINIVINSFKLAKYIKDNEIDIIHAHSRAPAWVGYLASKLTNTKYITTYHGIYSYHNIFKKWYSSPMRKGLKICVVSNFVGEHLSKEFNISKDKMCRVYRPFDEKQFSYKNIKKSDLKDIKTKYKLKKDDIILCMVGRFSRIKGQLELIEALSKLKSKNWKLLLVGSDNRKESNLTTKIKSLIAEYDLQDKIILTGNQKKPENFLAVSDIYLAMSVKPETFGRTPVEAQALGKMVIATKHGGHLETVLDGKTGFFVSPTDLNDWSEKIDFSINLSEEEKKKMGQTGKEWVYSQFTLDKVYSIEVELCRQIFRNYCKSKKK